MTKRDLINALEAFSDDQWVYVCLHSAAYPDGAQVIIQGAKPAAPWYGRGPDLIGLLAHDQNAELPIAAGGK